MLSDVSYPLSDAALSQRLEECEGKTNAAFVDAHARIAPDARIAWMRCAGAYVLYDGVGSPLTQTFGLGLFGSPSDSDVDRVEAFFDERGADVFHEVSPLSGAETLALLVRREYRPAEFTSVLFRPLSTDIAANDSQVTARIISPAEVELWADTTAEGWSEFEELSSFMRELARVIATSDGTSAFLAERGGRAIGTGAVAIHDGVALLAGASTIPPARKQGAQRALLQARLRHAAELGCDLAMMCASPGSASQRNAERQGFRIAYTRVKWARARSATIAV
jgi:GNAT superfamily N-acetyltransferase